MKVLYLDCAMGAAGDMLAGALLELMDDPQAAVEALNGLGIPGVEIRREASVKCGITGTHFSVLVHGAEEGTQEDHPSHAHLQDIRTLIAGLRLPQAVKDDMLAVYQRIAAAESKVHGVPVSQIHFHEVGALDAVADIGAVCYLMHCLAPDRVVASRVSVGGGQVRCAHGILPVPAPAAAELLRGIPIAGGPVPGELCTPTGAALLAHFVTEFGEMPPVCLEKTGYGLGKKDFPQANCLRAIWGTAGDGGDRIAELRCNVDDMTGEDLGFAMETLLSQGALDVFTVPVGMKKSRPGVMLCVLCRETDREAMMGAIFRHTTTLGIREHSCCRHTLARRETVADTPLGPVRKKESRGYGVCRTKYEYDDLSRIARVRNQSLAEVRKELEMLPE